MITPGTYVTSDEGPTELRNYDDPRGGVNFDIRLLRNEPALVIARVMHGKHNERPDLLLLILRGQVGYLSTLR